jgi:hypothetical protein
VPKKRTPLVLLLVGCLIALLLGGAFVVRELFVDRPPPSVAVPPPVASEHLPSTAVTAPSTAVTAPAPEAVPSSANAPRGDTVVAPDVPPPPGDIKPGTAKRPDGTEPATGRPVTTTTPQRPRKPTYDPLGI